MEIKIHGYCSKCNEHYFFPHAHFDLPEVKKYCVCGALLILSLVTVFPHDPKTPDLPAERGTTWISGLANKLIGTSSLPSPARHPFSDGTNKPLT